MKTLDYKKLAEFKLHNITFTNYYIVKNIFRKQVIIASYIWIEKDGVNKMKTLD